MKERQQVIGKKIMPNEITNRSSLNAEWCGKLLIFRLPQLLYFRCMKMQIAAICFNERELDLYVTQLNGQGFESLSEVKKAEDGTWYIVMARPSKYDSPVVAKAPAQSAEPLSA